MSELEIEKRTDKSLSLLTKGFVNLLSVAKNGILDIKAVSLKLYLYKLLPKWEIVIFRQLTFYL